jgi:hypothetical protein
MGYYQYYTNHYGIDVADEQLPEDVVLPANLAIFFVGEFDGADSRIDSFKYVLSFRKYSKGTDEENNKVSGDINGTPTDDEIAEMKAFCETAGITWHMPKREELSFIL